MEKRIRRRRRVHVEFFRREMGDMYTLEEGINAGMHTEVRVGDQLESSEYLPSKAGPQRPLELPESFSSSPEKTKAFKETTMNCEHRHGSTGDLLCNISGGNVMVCGD